MKARYVESRVPVDKVSHVRVGEGFQVSVGKGS